MVQGNQDGKFSVGFRDGVVRTVVGLDREAQAAYTLVIEAIDNGPAGGRRTGTATVFVEVLDVNDNRPIFLQSSYEASVLENVARGTSIVQMTMVLMSRVLRGSPFSRSSVTPVVRILPVLLLMGFCGLMRYSTTPLSPSSGSTAST
ncbi:LOW QUALITY PROTEIN: hypothetical protein CRUP_021213 [Coryphaenoides rupestris]|nr:LOW QUALITY PROTEIN: hypothetical protein CRUP_021213 [Coryphaenoides rupestris]